jgi:hypothetical protein
MVIYTTETEVSDDVGSPASGAPVRRRLSRKWIAVGLVLLLLAAGGLLAYRSGSDTSSDASKATPISAAELESRYGTRIDLVALTALGGLVQLRFTVLDKTKAETLFHVAEMMPALIAEPTGKVLHAPTGMRHHLTLLDGGSYFVLFANAGNALASGTPVSVLIDNVKLEHLVTAS